MVPYCHTKTFKEVVPRDFVYKCSCLLLDYYVNASSVAEPVEPKLFGVAEPVEPKLFCVAEPLYTISSAFAFKDLEPRKISFLFSACFLKFLPNLKNYLPSNYTGTICVP